MADVRFTVGSVTGWPITQATLNDGRAVRHKPTTLWYVHDSAYGYRVVATFHARGRWVDEAGEQKLTPQQAAEAHAAKLNKMDRKLRRAS